MKNICLWQKAPSPPGAAKNIVHIFRAGNIWTHITKPSQVCLLSLEPYLSRRNHMQRVSQPRNSVEIYSTVIQTQGNHLTASWSNLQRFHSRIWSSKPVSMVWKYKKINVAMQQNKIYSELVLSELSTPCKKTIMENSYDC